MRRLPAGLPHLLRIAACVSALTCAPHPPAAIAASVALFMAAFAANHDLVHDALGLPRWARDPLIAAAGLLMFGSGHAIRTMHLLHHRRALADGDVEGEAARLSPFRALLASPRISIRYRMEALVRANAHDRRWHAAESAVLAGLVLAALALGGALEVHLTVSLALNLGMPFWAGHVPHRAPRAWLVWARKLAWVRSPVILSFAFHELHHAHPRVPCHRLAEVAARA